MQPALLVMAMSEALGQLESLVPKGKEYAASPLLPVRVISVMLRPKTPMGSEAQAFAEKQNEPVEPEMDSRQQSLEQDQGSLSR